MLILRFFLFLIFFAQGARTLAYDGQVVETHFHHIEAKKTVQHSALDVTIEETELESEENIAEVGTANIIKSFYDSNFSLLKYFCSLSSSTVFLNPCWKEAFTSIIIWVLNFRI